MILPQTGKFTSVKSCGVNQQMQKMYLAIVLLSCFAFNVVHVSGDPGERLSCPYCFGNGEKPVDGQYKCDSRATTRQCSLKMVEPVCVTYSNRGYFSRSCHSKEEYNRRTKRCENGNCAMAMCEDSGCKATVPMPFSCQVCEGQQDSDCENSIRMKECKTYRGQPIKDPVCAAFKMNDGRFFERFCSSREEYNNDKYDCEEDGDCTVVMCEESGCKAEFSGSDITTLLR